MSKADLTLAVSTLASRVLSCFGDNPTQDTDHLELKLDYHCNVKYHRTIGDGLKSLEMWLSGGLAADEYKILVISSVQLKYHMFHETSTRVEYLKEPLDYDKIQYAVNNIAPEKIGAYFGSDIQDATDFAKKLSLDLGRSMVSAETFDPTDDGVQIIGTVEPCENTYRRWNTYNVRLGDGRNYVITDCDSGIKVTETSKQSREISLLANTVIRPTNYYHNVVNIDAVYRYLLSECIKHNSNTLMSKLV